ncbi:hypothetical protein G6031_01945 [Dietzia sp. CQ4]|uniref:hypothetical protein n=1 Tax=Dietzia sp. (strain CQ4) TaxID=370437 RepID=UPI0015F9A07B|nr:hypothetical protein [Dietzia sp. CQ4]MBB1033154.1 hypothetical protein [Dietzia sp. CQ4]
MAVTVWAHPDSANRPLSASHAVLPNMTSTPNIDYSDSRPLWVSVFLDTLVLSDGRVLSDGVYGPEHLQHVLADHRLQALDDVDALLNGDVDALAVRPIQGSR